MIAVMRTILSCCILLLFFVPLTFLEMGCPPPESELHNILIKAMHKNGCSGCSPEGEITNYVLVYLAEGNGSVTGEATQTVAENTDGTPVTAAANPGYHFTQWSDGLQEATRQDTAVTADLSVTAQFAINTYAIECLVTGGGNCTADPTAVDHGGTSRITVTPNAGWRIRTITDSEEGPKPGSYTTSPVTANRVISVIFDINQYTLTYQAGANGSIVGETAQTVPENSNGSAVTATPAPGYHFVQWSDGSLAATRHDTHVTSDITVTAQFAIDTYSIVCTVVGEGTCTANPALVNHGETSVITVTPDMGWRILSIVDSEEGLQPGSYTTRPVTAPRAVTAAFEVDHYTLTYSAGEGGTLQGPTSQSVGHGADGETVTAQPNRGYEFTGWSDGITEAKRKDTHVSADITVTALFAVSPLPWIESFKINRGDSWTTNPVMVLHNSYIGSAPEEYMASEFPDFRGAAWQPYSPEPSFTVIGSTISRTIYFKLRNQAGEHEAAHDTIYLAPEIVPVEAGAFTMGRTEEGDDAALGGDAELPRHKVTLDAYQIGKYEITNQQYCDVLTWAAKQGYLYSDLFGTPWQGLVNIYAGGNFARNVILNFLSPSCNIRYNAAEKRFEPKVRTGLPGGRIHSTAEHPVVEVSWYGAVAFCNWLSEMLGLKPCYKMNIFGWPLDAIGPEPGGFRLPTEAEWERAAAWDASKHWIYAFGANTIGGKKRCNYHTGTNHINPLGLTTEPFTAAVGWFNGLNVSPNGNIATTASVSPVGAYDMSGNAAEWCQDWFSEYTKQAQVNPLGPATGTDRIRRGGAWNTLAKHCRTADRSRHAPGDTYSSLGFRIARTP